MGIIIDDEDGFVPDPAVWQERHPSVQHFEPLFAFDRLPEGPIRGASMSCAMLAEVFVSEFPDGPELSAGLRKLLEARDCFVRVAVLATRDTP
jgi:hypothetical protein